MVQMKLPIDDNTKCVQEILTILHIEYTVKNGDILFEVENGNVAYAIGLYVAARMITEH